MKLLLKSIWDYYSKYKMYSSLFFFGVLLDLAVESFVALSFKILLDKAIVPQNQGVLISVLSLLLIGTIVSKIGYIFRWYLYSKMTAGIMRNVRNQLVSSLQQLSMRYFSNARTGDILSLFSNDVSSIEGLLNMAVPVGIGAFLGIIINTGIIFYLEWKLAILALGGLLLCALGPYFFSSRALEANDLKKGKQSELLSVVEENVAAQKVIKSFNLHNVSLINFQKKTEDFAKVTARATFSNEVLEFIPKSIIEIFNLFIICVGAILAFNGYITPGIFVSFNSLFIGLSTAVGSFTWVFPMLVDSSASIKRIRDLMDENMKSREFSGTQAILEFREAIEFSDVSFGYTDQQTCLKHIDLHIPKGMSVAFVGRSGSGKSSILNLIMRFYDPQYGSIRIDDQDVRDITRESLHRLLGIVLQENFLFNTSIRENLLMVNPDASDDEIVNSAKAAEIHDFIMGLPEGYDTLVGERGGLLSGGQRQRIAIARALIHKPSILIMDEATSALDPKTEKAINDTLKRIAKGMTVINITHRLESIKDYDLIYVMEKGRIVENGSHEALIAKQGIYTELLGKQGGFLFTEDLKYAEIAADRLSRINVFKGLENEMLEELAELFVSEYYSPGQHIINTGDYGERFYVIARGRVEVYITLEDGTPKIINVLEDGDYFGEIALLKDVVRTANVRTNTPCTILSLKRRFFERIISKKPELKQKLESETETRLRQLSG